MKQYDVSVDMTVAVTVSVEAENEEVAKKLAIEKAKDQESYYMANYDCVSKFEVTDVEESEEERTELDDALDYVRDNMDADDMADIQAAIKKCYKQHLVPDDTLVNCERLCELLGEYGEENDLAEDWWEDEYDMSDILAKL